MKSYPKILCLLTMCFLILPACVSTKPLSPTPLVTSTLAPTTSPTLSPLTAAQNLHWFGYNASLLYHGSQNIYFDPVVLSGDPPPADLILITHSHTQAFSPEDIKKIITPETTVIIGPNVTVLYALYQDELGVPAIVLNEGERTNVKGIEVEATHVVENPSHLPATGIIGFIVTIDGIRIYHAAETLYYPEMANYSPDITIYSVFSELGDDEIEQFVHGLQTNILIFARIPPSLAQIYADRYNQQGLPIQFFVPPTGPYKP